MSENAKLIWFVSAFLTASVLHAYFSHPGRFDKQLQCQPSIAETSSQSSEQEEQPESSKPKNWI